VIVHYLLESDTHKKCIKVEVSNGNGSQFKAKMVREYLGDNGITQLFAQPNTSEEIGTIKSFQAMLNNSIGNKEYDTLEELESRLNIFYNTCFVVRLHCSICNLPPRVFKLLWVNKLIKMEKSKKYKAKFKLIIPYYQSNRYLSTKKRKKCDHRAMRG